MPQLNARELLAAVGKPFADPIVVMGTPLERIAADTCRTIGFGRLTFKANGSTYPDVSRVTNDVAVVSINNPRFGFWYDFSVRMPSEDLALSYAGQIRFADNVTGDEAGAVREVLARAREQLVAQLPRPWVRSASAFVVTDIRDAAYGCGGYEDATHQRAFLERHGIHVTPRTRVKQVLSRE